MSMCKEGKLRRPVIDWLCSLGMTPVFEVYLRHGTCDIVGVQWGERFGRSVPAMLRIVAIELKVSDVAGVLRQAEANRPYIGESYAAMPKWRTQKMRQSTLQSFKDAGVGLISVTEESCRCLVMPLVNLDADSQMMKRKLWRRRDQWPKRIDKTHQQMLQEQKRKNELAEPI